MFKKVLTFILVALMVSATAMSLNIPYCSTEENPFSFLNYNFLSITGKIVLVKAKSNVDYSYYRCMMDGSLITLIVSRRTGVIDAVVLSVPDVDSYVFNTLKKEYNKKGKVIINTKNNMMYEFTTFIAFLTRKNKITSFSIFNASYGNYVLSGIKK